MSIPLLRTKLHIPGLKPGTITRPRLTQKLTTSSQGAGKLALVVAPAGYGKTTLLSAWHAERPDRAMAWLTLDDDDNDPTRFWSYAVAALETLAPIIPEGTLSQLPLGQLPEETVLAHLVNELTTAPRPFTLVLDDFHKITNPDILAWMAFVIDNQPPGLHLVLNTRAIPPLPLARPRAQGRLTDITVQDLRFTAAEAAAFLRQTMALHLDERDVEALVSRTEGWIAGLQLAGLSLRDTADVSVAIEHLSGTTRYVADYFVEEVLARQPPEITSFLIETAFLDMLTAPLCDAITGRDDSAEILATLERHNLFVVPQDDHHEVFTYHGLFSDLLRARQNARCTAAEIAALHRRVSDWCLDNGMVENAISHAFLAQDYDRAAELLQEHGYTLVGRGQARTVEHWLDRFPASHRGAYPGLDLLAAWTCLGASRFGEVESYLGRVEAHLAEGWFADSPEILRDTQGQIKAIRATAAMNLSDSDAAILLGREALADLHPANDTVRSVVTLDLADALFERDDLPEAVRLYRDALNSAQPTGNAIISINAMSKLARLQVIQGNLHAAAESYHESLRTLQRWGWEDQPVVGLITSGMASLLYEWNALDQALGYAYTSLENLTRWGHAYHITEVRLLLARIEHARGHPDLAEEHLTTAAAWGRRNGQRHLERWVLEARARLALSVGDRARALVYFNQIERQFPGTLTQHTLGLLPRVYPLILGRDHDDAEAILAEAERYARRRGLTVQRIEEGILRAINALAQDRRDTALAALQDALILAEPGGFMRTFVDGGPPVHDLLRLAANREMVPRAYVARLLDVLSARGPTLVEPLSPREEEVLHLIADQRSNQEIAEALFVSINTVKTHVKRLYGKLSASSRLEAVTRARELGLL